MILKLARFLSKDTNALERRHAKKDGIVAVKNSGRGERKGDARNDQYLIDYKFNAKTFTLTAKNWHKLAEQAWKDNHRDACIVVVFEDGTEIVVIDKNSVWETINDNM